jgi:citrate lyase beta subunit
MHHSLDISTFVQALINLKARGCPGIQSQSPIQISVVNAKLVPSHHKTEILSFLLVIRRHQFSFCKGY